MAKNMELHATELTILKLAAALSQTFVTRDGTINRMEKRAGFVSWVAIQLWRGTDFSHYTWEVDEDPNVVLRAVINRLADEGAMGQWTGLHNPFFSATYSGKVIAGTSLGSVEDVRAELASEYGDDVDLY